jgi:uncharacterized UPF0160 family protein
MTLELSFLLLLRLLIILLLLQPPPPQLSRTSASPTDKEILTLDEGMPWQRTVLEHSEYILYVVFPSGGTWRVQAVPEKLGSFNVRQPLPQEWAGLPEEELKKITGVDDAVFCHPGRFICGARTKEGALALARLAL